MSDNIRELDIGEPGDAEKQRKIAEMEEEAAFYKRTYTPPEEEPPVPPELSSLRAVGELIIRLSLEAQNRPPGARRKPGPDIIGGWVAGGPPGLDKR